MVLKTENIEETAKKELVSGLKLLGLASYEASTFYTLVKHSEMTAADLSRKTGIPDSKIYNTLNSLEQRGMISIQKGRPSLFKAFPPEEAMDHLRRVLNEEHKQKMKILDTLIVELSGLYESVEGREEMELAYVVRGIRAILGKMNNLIGQAQHNLLLFAADMKILKEVEQSLVEASNRGVKIELGLTERVEPTPTIERLGTIKRVECQYGLLVVDDQTLLDLYANVAVLTQRPNAIQFIREYYNNPKCSVLSYDQPGAN